MRRWFGLLIIGMLFAAPIAAQAAEYADVVNKVVDQVSSGLAQLTESIKVAAPEAWRLAVEANRTQAAVAVGVGMVFFGIGAVSLITSTILYLKGVRIKALYRADHSGKYRYCDAEPYFIGGTAALVIGFAALVISLVVISINLAMFLSPEAMTARDFLFGAIGR